MGVEVVADLVASGETAEQNGLVEIITLMNVYPALVQKAES
jgi:ATP phosphoribosyltransferase